MARIASDISFTLYNQSQISELTINATSNPVVLMATTLDKGPETLQKISGNDFYKSFVTNKKTLFAKHGQSALTASGLIDSGATLLLQRIVATDAKLANALVSVNVVRAAGTPATGTPQLTLKVVVDTITDCSSLDDIKAHAATIASVSDPDNRTFPLFAIADVGRGTSDKKFRIIPDYTTYKEISFMRYCIQIIEGTEVKENIYFSLNNDLQYAGVNYGLDSVIKNNSTQVTSYSFENYTELFLEYMSEILGVTTESLYAYDPIYGASRSGVKDPEIEISADTIALNTTLGISLLSGDDGSFTDKPINEQTAVTEQLVKFYTGEINDDIYDLNKYQIDAVFDSNLDEEVKRVIEQLAVDREDFIFFEDLGIVRTYDQIKAAAEKATASKFVALYHNSWDEIDPYSKKQINVTILYQLSKLFVNHFRSGKTNPFEGIKYGITFTGIVDGTVNYIPKKLKNSDQKQALADINVNYAAYYNDTLVMESECTSDATYSQLSFINNVLAVQEVVKMLRVEAPKTRYTFISADGTGDESAFTNYKQDCEDKLARYKSNFASLEFKYTYDETQVQNKVFYAAIYFTFRDFIESEHFDLFAINASSTVA